MTPADMHFVARLVDAAENFTISNETAIDLINETAHGISETASHIITHAEPSKISVQMPWIELGLIPIAPVIACYLFTKIAEFIFDRIAALRQRLFNAHPNTSTMSLKGDHDDAHLGQLNAHPDDNPEVAAYRKLIAEAEAKAAKDASTGHGLGKSVFRYGPNMTPRSTAESSQMAGANAQKPVYIGNNFAIGQLDGGTLTRGRDQRYGVGARGRGGTGLEGERGVVERGGEQHGRRAEGAGEIPLVGDASVGQKKSKRDGWWFDVRWN